MDYFTKNKMLFWLVTLLVLLNAATLASLWHRKPPMLPARSYKTPNSQDIMKERLRLSDEQALRFEQIREEHFMRTRPLQEDMHKIRLDLLDAILAPEPNQAKTQNLLTELGNKTSQFEENLYKHFQELKNACNESQAKELKFMLTDLIESTRPRSPRHGPPPEHGPGPTW